MDRREIVDALTALAAELESRGVSAEMYIVGGAAIALAFDERRATRDIDAVFEPKSIVYEAAAVVGERLGLPGGWLNDAVKGFLTGNDPAAAPVLTRAEEVLAIAERTYGERLEPAARFFVEQIFDAG
jgi:hypothetical protein